MNNQFLKQLPNWIPKRTPPLMVRSPIPPSTSMRFWRRFVLEIYGWRLWDMMTTRIRSWGMIWCKIVVVMIWSKSWWSSCGWNCDDQMDEIVWVVICMELCGWWYAWNCACDDMHGIVYVMICMDCRGDDMHWLSGWWYAWNKGLVMMRGIRGWWWCVE